ncbi:trypco2 family protein [Leptothoe sp. ISB3NOV94-8A]
MAKLGLKETVEALRTELSEAILVAEGKEIRFEMGEIELEFQVLIEQTSEGKGGIKFWVVELGGGSTEKNAAIHKVKIPLKPVWKDGAPVLTGDQGKIPG